MAASTAGSSVKEHRAVSHEDWRPARASTFLALSGLVFAVSVAVTIEFCFSMAGGMEMPGGWTMSMMWMRMPGQTWMESGAMFLLMWLAMMVAMMLPSALPMLLTFRGAFALESHPHPDLSTLCVACGYFGVWTAVGAGVYVVGVFWALATMRWSDLSQAVPALTGVSLALAGVFQFSSWKITRLSDCRNPIACSKVEKSEGLRAALMHGVRQGRCCTICCSGLMLVFIVLGSMNLLVMLLVATVIAAEKIFPKPHLVVQFTGVVAVAAGIISVLMTIH